MMQGMGGGMGGMGGYPGAAGAGGAGAAGAQADPFGGMDPAMMAAMMGGNPGAGAAGGMPTGQPADTRPPREKYATQLQQIKEMGFNDEDAIL